MKAVFDTNILISGHFWRGAPYHCVLAAEAGLVVLVFTDATVLELRNKLTGKFKRSAAEAAAVITRLSAAAEHVPSLGRSGWVTEDPDDDKFIDAALSGGASVIVSGDRHLLELKAADGVEILSARQFLDRLPILSALSGRSPR